MAEDGKTEKATPKKRKDERKKGNIFQSQDIVNAFSILAIFYTLKIFFPFIFRYLKQLVFQYILHIKNVPSITTEFMMQVLRDGIIALFLIAGPVMLAAMAVGVIVSGTQTGFLFSQESLKMKFSRLSPIQGIKKLISIRSVVELVKSLLKTFIIAYVFYTSIQDIAQDAMKLMSIEIIDAVIFVLNAIMDLVIKLSLVFLGLAALDYLYQWWEYEKNIKMTKQEIKEEYKHSEGDPQIKAKIRETQRKLSMQRMMQQVPDADVIVRNPTHFAIALKYDLEKNNAPIVLAKGQDHVAFRIIAVAEEHHIPMMENPTLARALYAQVDVNHEIPAEYYSILAEIMAWVYSLKKGMKQQ